MNVAESLLKQIYNPVEKPSMAREIPNRDEVKLTIHKLKRKLRMYIELVTRNNNTRKQLKARSTNNREYSFGNVICFNYL